MEFKKNQVKILANTSTGREMYVDLQDVILNPGDEKEITLGKQLDFMAKEIETLKKESRKSKKAISKLILVANKLNLKNKKDGKKND